MRVEVIEEPYDDDEQYLLWRLEELQREYQREAKPFVDRLLKSRATKMPRYVVVPEPGDNLRRTG